MARYFFHLKSDVDLNDSIGSDHDDLDSVRSEAVESIGEHARSHLLHLTDTSDWLMNVTNESGSTVMLVSLVASVTYSNAASADRNAGERTAAFPWMSSSADVVSREG